MELENMLHVGDVVKIREDLHTFETSGENREAYDIHIDEAMTQYAGKELKIENRYYSKTYDNIIGRYEFILKDNDTTTNWIWTLKMLDAEYIKEHYGFTLDELLEAQDRRKYMRECHCCGAEIDTREGENETWYVVDGCHVCEVCYEGETDECYECGERHFVNDMSVGCDYNRYCADCFDNQFVVCDDCGATIWRDEAVEVEDEDGDRLLVCENCEGHYSHNRIYSYHEANKTDVFYNASDEEVDDNTMYMGTELEVYNRYDDTSCIDYLYDNLNVVLEHDSSIGEGYEIISKPQTYKYIVENQESLKNALQKLIECGYTSHDAGSCGLHVHVTRPFDKRISKLNKYNASDEEKAEQKELLDKQQNIIDRILLVLEVYKNEFIKFSRRTSSQLSDWANFLSDYVGIDNNSIKSLYYVKKLKDKNDGSRYMALNLCNSHTLEFRLFRGTLNFDTYMATIELVNNIMTLCGDLSINVEDITWSRLTETKYASAYCELKDIHTDKVIVDNSLEEIEKENHKKEIMQHFKKHIKTIWNNELNNLYENVKITYKLNDITSSNVSSQVNIWYDTKRNLENIFEKLNGIMYDIEHELYDEFITHILRLADKIDLDDRKYTKIKQDIEYILY